ncbi:MAG: hypothetical protein IRZ11_00880 [Clostridia bacterium]|nr:hypothetical protein [Clostridia bacterium]
MRRVSAWLREDLWIKVASVVIAVLLWVNVVGPPRSSPLAPVQATAQNVPVEWRHLPDGLSVARLDPPVVAVTFRAPATIADGLGPGSFAAFVDLRDAEAGRLAFNVDVAVPAQVQLVSVEPQRVTVTLAAVSAREVPVTVRVSGQPADGFRAGAARATPEAVEVSGPTAAVAAVASVVATADVAGREADLTVDAPLTAVDADGDPVEGVALDPATARVTVPVAAWAEKVVPVEASLAGEPAAGYRVERVGVEPAEVRLSGPKEALDAIASVYAQPLDVAGRDADLEAKVGLILPAGVTSDPAEVTVSARIVKAP